MWAAKYQILILNMPDYIPDTAAEYEIWLDNLIAYATTNQTELRLSADDLAPLQESRDAWQEALEAYRVAQATAEIAQQTRNDRRRLTETRARALVQMLQANPDLTDPQRVALGITVRSNTRTAVAAPTTRPIPRLEQSGRLRHTIHFADETTPNRRAKPQGVRGCQIWVYVGETPPTRPEETFRYLGTDTRTPYLSEFDPEDGGEQAHYYLRWVNTRDEPGPWSDAISGSILA